LSGILQFPTILEASDDTGVSAAAAVKVGVAYQVKKAKKI
jgi:hypothetical protein